VIPGGGVPLRQKFYIKDKIMAHRGGGESCKTQGKGGGLGGGAGALSFTKISGGNTRGLNLQAIQQASDLELP